MIELNSLFNLFRYIDICHLYCIALYYTIIFFFDKTYYLTNCLYNLDMRNSRSDINFAMGKALLIDQLNSFICRVTICTDDFIRHL